MQNQITYDQPLNEIIRACLRMEQIFQQVDYQLQDTSVIGTRQLIRSIIDLLNLVERPDLKSKLAKELSHHHTSLLKYQESTALDTEKWKEITKSLHDESRHLIDSSGKIAYRLREIELLMMLKLHLASPGGGCGFDLPVYHYWLSLPAKTRLSQIQSWLSEFTDIRRPIELLLNLVRQLSRTEKKIAQNGFYQELLDPQTPMRLLRVTLDKTIATFPEISVGRHFLSVRYFNPEIEKRPTQYQKDVPFTLTYCYA